VNDDLDKCYELLGVAPGTPGRELKEAYRDLAKVWHPDRFAHDPRLQHKAQEKLKEINEAYERLTSGGAGRRAHYQPTPREPRTPAAARGTRQLPRMIVTAAVLLCVALLAAWTSFVQQGAGTSPDRTPPAEGAEARPSDRGPQSDGGARANAGQPARGKERPARQSRAEATPGDDDSGTGAGARQLRPMPTVTVNIDPMTGMLATRDCPNASTMTYPAGDEPRQHCTAHRKAQTGAPPETERPKGSRLKSIGKGLATPFKWLGGGRGTEGGNNRDAQPPADGGSQNR
jgi:DnaJ domain